MNRFRLFLGPIFLVIIMVFSSCGRGRPALSGASGPRLETLSPAPAPVQIDDAFIVTDYNPWTAGAPPHEQRFATGTKKLNCVVVFKDTPPEGTRISCDVAGPSGKVEGSGAWMQMGNAVKHVLKAWTEIEPKAGLPDGAYQATIGINDIQVYRVNWSIGSK